MAASFSIVCTDTSSQAYLRLPFLQNCFHISLLSIGPSCMPQTIGQQGVGTCTQSTNTHISLYFYFCDYYELILLISCDNIFIGIMH